MPIKLIQTGSQPPLAAFLIACDERVNLFLGPNASGKSTILREMKHFYSKNRERVLHFEREEELVEELNRCFNVHKDADERESATLSARRTVERVQDLANSFFSTRRNPVHEHRDIYCSTHTDWYKKFIVVEDTSDSKPSTWDTAPLLYIPATRINLAEGIPTDMDDGYNDYSPKGLFDTISGNFYGQDVELAINWLRKTMDSNRNQRYQFRRAVELGYSCAKSICAEVIYDDIPHTFVELREVEGDIFEMIEEYDTERVDHPNMGIGTNDDPLGEPLYAGALSSGTQGILLWIYALAFKMAYHYGWEPGWENKRAILLIDEIENHLHPTWQRRVIPALLEHFPGLQIFATTHSPFVVAGLKAGQVHLLNRDEDGVVTATTNTEDIVGWTADEILRTMMGVEDPTDVETAKAAGELRRLRNEAPRSDSREEELRQKRMQELRQLVDRDLLAGGPWKKQRELFEEQFAEALKKYQQSQDLNQENR